MIGQDRTRSICRTGNPAVQDKLGVLCKKVFAIHAILNALSKGQIISECPYEIIVSPKIPTKKFLRFLP